MPSSERHDSPTQGSAAARLGDGPRCSRGVGGARERGRGPAGGERGAVGGLEAPGEGGHGSTVASPSTHAARARPTLTVVPSVVTGSAGRPWPVDGCRCVACGSGAAEPAGLRSGQVVVAGGRVDGFPLEPGDRHEVDGVRVIGLPGAAPDRPAIVVGTPELTVLWAEGPGDLPET